MHSHYSWATDNLPDDADRTYDAASHTSDIGSERSAQYNAHPHSDQDMHEELEALRQENRRLRDLLIIANARNWQYMARERELLHRIHNQPLGFGPDIDGDGIAHVFSTAGEYGWEGQIPRHRMHAAPYSPIVVREHDGGPSEPAQEDRRTTFESLEAALGYVTFGVSIVWVVSSVMFLVSSF